MVAVEARGYILEKSHPKNRLDVGIDGGVVERLPDLRTDMNSDRAGFDALITRHPDIGNDGTGLCAHVCRD